MLSAEGLIYYTGEYAVAVNGTRFAADGWPGSARYRPAVKLVDMTPGEASRSIFAPAGRISNP
jgi:hypothetical protein